ncbi:MAG: glycosyltransferase family 4 protein [Planctomycetota bacterium]
MKLIYLTAGAGGMFCGSCMHDNALSRALADYGWDIQLVPTYTPIRTDEKDVSVDQVLFGGVNVYLQQKIPLLRYVPAFLDRFLDSPWLIRRVTSRAMETNPTMLGKLAVSMLKGKHGNQRKEVKQLCKWIQLSKPGLVIFSNILIGGCIESIKQETQIPVLVTLQGDDVFLDSLKEPYRSQCLSEIRKIVPHVDGFLVQSEFFRDYMSDYFSIDPAKFHVTPLGIDVTEFEPYLSRGHSPFKDRRPTIGYLARLANEKGLHHLVDAFIHLKTEMLDSDPLVESIFLKIAGWMGPDHRDYAEAQFQRMVDAGLAEDFEYVGSIERDEKLEFLGQIDLLSVPTEFLEPKGIYALEALAAGVPVVLPEHGAFPELVRPSKGGVLVPPRDPRALASAWLSVLTDHQMRQELASAGQAYVHSQRNSESMAESTTRVIERLTGHSHQAP